MKKGFWQLILLLALFCSITGAHSSTVTYIYTNPQGTTLAEADANGNVVATFEYSPYGSLTLGSPANGPGYTGHVNDPDTGLVYMQARYYDPAIGRFLSVDPIAPKPGDAFSFNRHAYVNNNPIGNIDPDGRSVTCNDYSCTIDSHSVVEAAVDYGTVGIIILRRLIDNATSGATPRPQAQHQEQQPADQAPPQEGGTDAAPALPTGLVGEAPRATGKNGGTAIGTSLPGNKFADTVKALTGGTLGVPDSKGRSTSPNGVSVRTGGKDGPRIDIPGTQTKPPEIIHFPKDTPIPDNLKSNP